MTEVTVGLVSLLGMSVSTDRDTSTKNQWVPVAAVVSFAGWRVPGASVTFTITKPNGAVVTGTPSTDATGSAALRFRVKQQDPLGTYRVAADANLNNSVFGKARTSFTVQ